MNYAQIKQNLISLGFAETSDYTEFEDLGYTYDAINRAISMINNQFPYVAKYEFDIAKDDVGLLYIDMADMDGFLSLADTPVQYAYNRQTTDAAGNKSYEEVPIYKAFNDFWVENGSTIVIDADKIHMNTDDANLFWSFRIFYDKQCTQVDATTLDSFIPELPLAVHHLIPLLAAYYLWLDDDPAKAAQYYNMYETQLSLILQKNQQKVRMRVNTEWRGL